MTRRRRTRLALAATLLWLLGIEVLPNLHVALHDELASHTHVAGGIVFTVTYGVTYGEPVHVHPDGTIHRPSRPTRDRDAIGNHHGDGSLAHHAAAMAPVPPPITKPLPVDRHAMIVAIAIAIDLVSLDPLAASARGPPLVA